MGGRVVKGHVSEIRRSNVIIVRMQQLSVELYFNIVANAMASIVCCCVRGIVRVSQVSNATVSREEGKEKRRE